MRLQRTPRQRRVFIVALPLDPRLRGTLSCYPVSFIRRAKSEWLVPLTSGPLGPGSTQIYGSPLCHTPPALAELWQPVDQARSKAKLCTKFFAKLSFKKAAGEKRNEVSQEVLLVPFLSRKGTSSSGSAWGRGCGRRGPQRPWPRRDAPAARGQSPAGRQTPPCRPPSCPAQESNAPRWSWS